MPVMKIRVVPIGTESPSVSKYISAILAKIKKEKGSVY